MQGETLPRQGWTLSESSPGPRVPHPWRAFVFAPRVGQHDSHPRSFFDPYFPGPWVPQVWIFRPGIARPSPHAFSLVALAVFPSSPQSLPLPPRFSPDAESRVLRNWLHNPFPVSPCKTDMPTKLGWLAGFRGPLFSSPYPESSSVGKPLTFR
jgi:hypothetical protein